MLITRHQNPHPRTTSPKRVYHESIHSIPPVKNALAPVHARSYATVQKLLCHGNYCELILSPVRASFKQPSAARPATGPTNSVAHPSIRGSAALLPNNVHSKIAPNPRQLITRSPPRCRTSIIQSSALVQASFSLSMVALAARPRRSSPKNFYFRHFFPRVLQPTPC